MGRLWDIVQKHIDAQPYGVSQRRIAATLGMSPTALGNWRDPKALPSPANLHALANLTGTPYLRVLDAALEDAGYIPRAGEHGGDTATTKPGPDGPAPIDMASRRRKPVPQTDKAAARKGRIERSPEDQSPRE